jgi:hypothetical protein
MKKIFFSLIVIFLIGCENYNDNKVSRIIEGEIYFALDNLYKYSIETNSWTVIAKDINIYEAEFVDINKDFLVYYNFADDNISFISLNTAKLQPVSVENIASNISISHNSKYLGFSLLGDENYYIFDLVKRVQHKISLSHDLLQKGKNVSWGIDNENILLTTKNGICIYSWKDKKELKYIDGRYPFYVSKNAFAYIKKNNGKNDICLYKNGKSTFLFSISDFLNSPIVIPDKNLIYDIVYKTRLNSVYPAVRIYDVPKKEQFDLPKVSNLSRKAGVVLCNYDFNNDKSKALLCMAVSCQGSGKACSFRQPQNHSRAIHPLLFE